MEDDRIKAALEQKLRTEIANVQRRITEKRAELKAQSEERRKEGVVVYQLEQQLKAVDAKIENVTRENENSKARRVRVEGEVALKEKLLASQTQALAELKTRTSTLRSSCDALARQLPEPMVAVEELEGEAAVMEQVMAAQEKELEEGEREQRRQARRHARLEKKIEALDAEISHCEEETRIHEEEAREARVVVTATEDITAKVERDVAAIREATARVLSEVEKANADIDKSRTAERAIYSEAQSLQSSVTRLERDHHAQRESLRNVEELVKQRTATVQSLEAEAKELEAEQELHKEELAKITAQIKEREETIQQVQRERAACNRRVIELNSEIEIAHAELTQARLKANTKAADISSLSAKSATTLKTIQKTQNTIKSLHKKLDKLNNRKEAADIESRQLIQELATATEESEERRLQCERNATALLAMKRDLEGTFSLLHRRQKALDELGAKLDEHLQRMPDASMGPLEATLKNLMRDIELKETRVADLQKEWVWAQLKELQQQQQVGEAAENRSQLESRIALLKRCRDRDEERKVATEAEIKNVLAGHRKLQGEMGKANKLVSLCDQRTKALSAEVEGTQRALEHGTRDHDTQCQSLYEKCERVGESVARAEQRVRECEGEIKELEAKLSAHATACEIRANSDLPQRLSQLQKREVALKSELDQAVREKEAITARTMQQINERNFAIVPESDETSRTKSQSRDWRLKAALNGARSKIRNLTRELSRHESQLRDDTARLAELQDTEHRLKADIARLRAEMETLERDIKRSELDTKVLLQQTVRVQRACRAKDQSMLSSEGWDKLMALLKNVTEHL